jgi:hypothetical protein
MKHGPSRTGKSGGFWFKGKWIVGNLAILFAARAEILGR